MKKSRTSEALRWVTSILQEVNRSPGAMSPASMPKPIGPRTATDTSNSGNDFNKRTSRKPKRKGVVFLGATHSQRSLSGLREIPSYTSSQLSRRRGGVPSNTPDDRATYTIKRSASAETEEFLKIDISVRGNTSYLPSEARRIHTPPLPQDGLDGRKRGFFFDYNTPKSLSKSMRPSSTSPLLRRDRNPERRTSGASTIGKRTTSFKIKKSLRISTADWYDMKLAQVDNTGDDLDDDNGDMEADLWSTAHDASIRGGIATVNCCDALEQSKKLQEDEEFDMTIPEHLPTSPLCPRNPRYWRVVQGRGSQFRGCWMHGVGVYNGHALNPAAPT